MEKIQKKVEHYIEAYHMLDGVENVVAGVSGGADSMCMLNLLLQLRERYGYHLAVVHIHHGLRGQSADEDMEYVEKFCGEKKIEFFGFHYKVEELAKVWHMKHLKKYSGRTGEVKSLLRITVGTAVKHSCFSCSGGAG